MVVGAARDRGDRGPRATLRNSHSRGWWLLPSLLTQPRSLWDTEVASSPRDPVAVPGRAGAVPAEPRAGSALLPGPSPHRHRGSPLVYLVGHRAGLVTVPGATLL